MTDTPGEVCKEIVETAGALNIANDLSKSLERNYLITHSQLAALKRLLFNHVPMALAEPTIHELGKLPEVEDFILQE